MDIKNNQYGRCSEYAARFGLKYVPGAKPWSVPVDIALPSATQNEIDGKDAKELVKNGVKCVAEGANMPSTLEAVDTFLEAKILYAPGKASNAGGVATSGLEMTQNAQRLPWAREGVDAELHRIMKDIHANCVRYGAKDGGFVNYVDGANIAGFVKVADAMTSQGTY
jgi:glutamate dehydrogenase (NADP+)